MTRIPALMTTAAASLLAANPAISEELRIEAGPDLTIALGARAELSGSVSKAAAIGWSKVEGPGDVVFESPHAARTQATFSQPGEYQLMLGGFDGYVAYDVVRVMVRP